jgi:hypothetical protein
MNNHNQFLDIVQLGQFQPLWPAAAGGPAFWLTGSPMLAAQSPESAELNLLPYEGRAILVQVITAALEFT